MAAIGNSPKASAHAKTRLMHPSHRQADRQESKHSSTPRLRNKKARPASTTAITLCLAWIRISQRGINAHMTGLGRPSLTNLRAWDGEYCIPYAGCNLGPTAQSLKPERPETTHSQDRAAFAAVVRSLRARTPEARGRLRIIVFGHDAVFAS